MNDIIQVKVLQTNKDAGNEKFGLHLLESTSTAHMVTKVSTDKQIHDQIEVLSVLECVGHVNNKRMFET